MVEVPRSFLAFLAEDRHHGFVLVDAPAAAGAVDHDSSVFGCFGLLGYEGSVTGRLALGGAVTCCDVMEGWVRGG